MQITMTSFIVLVAVLCVTVNMSHRVAATDTANTDEEYDDDDASQEDHHQNFTHFHRHHNHSSSTAATPEETDDEYPDENVDVGIGNPHPALRLPEGSIRTSPGVLSQFSTPETPFQTLTSTVNQAGWLDISQVAEPLEEASERSEIEGVPESSTVFGFRSRLEASYSGSVIYVYASSGFETSETVMSGIAASNAAGIVASTPAETVASTPAGTVDSTPVEIVASTPAETVASTPAGTVDSTPVEIVASTRVINVSSTSVGTVASTRAGTVASTPVRTVASTPIGTVASTRAGTVATATEHVESTAREHGESTDTEHVESTATEHVESTATEHGESTDTEHVESTATEHVESTSTDHVESTATDHVESTATDHVESTATDHVESTATEHVESIAADHVESTATGHVESTSTEHVESTATDHVESTSTDHAESSATDNVESTSTEHVESTSTEHVESTAAEQAESTSTEHVESTATDHVESTSTDHAESSATDNVESTSTEHVESTSTEHVESTAAEQAESTSTEHVESTAIDHVESTSTDHAESSATDNVESTSTEHVESKSTEHVESTAAEQAESTSTEHVESTATEHVQSTSTGHSEAITSEHVESTVIDHVESTVIKHPESITNVQDESVSTLTEIWNFPTRASLQDSPHTPHETSIEFHAGLPSYMTLISADIPSDLISAAPTTSSFIRVSSTVSATILYPDSSQADTTAQRESVTAISSHECSICSSVVSSLEDIASTTVYTPESSPFPSDLNIQTSTADMPAESFPHTYSQMDVESSSSVFAFYTPWYLDGSEVQLTSTLFSQPSIPQSLSPRRDIHISSTEYTAAVTSFHEATEDRISSSYSFQDTLHSYTTFLRETTEDRISSSYSFQDTLHSYTTFLRETTEDRISSSYSFQDTLHSYTTFLRETTEDRISSSYSFQDTLHSYTTSLDEATEDRISSSYSFQDALHSYTTSRLDSSLHLTPATSPASDAVLHTEELRSSSRYETPSVSATFLSSVQVTPSRREAVDTSAYHVHDFSDVVTSIGYDRLHTSGVIDTSAHDSRHALGENNTSRYHLLHSTEDTVASIYETLHINGSLTASSSGFSSHLLMHVSATLGGYLETSVESELRPSVYPGSSVPVSAASILTTLLFMTSLSTRRHFEADTVSVFSQWESGEGSVDVATLSSTFTPTITTEEALTLGQISSVTPSATTDIGIEEILTRSFLETSFGIATSIEQSPTSIHRDLSTITTSLSTTTTSATTVENTTLATTQEHTTPHIETSTDFVPKVISNFTIAIYFYGNCEKASQKKYTGILNVKMLQFIRNASQLDDKSSILIGHIKCQPNHIPVSFFQADRTLVFLYLNDTFSASPRYLQIHSMVLNLTGYSEGFDTRKGESEITTSDITIFATASCIGLVLIIAGIAIFAKEIYHKKFSDRLSCPSSLGIHLKSEVVALRGFPANNSDYKHAEMNEAAFVNEAYSSRCEDEQSSVASEMKTAFPSSECNSPEETRDATSPKAPAEKNADNATKSAMASSVSLSNGTNRQEPPGYGLIIGLMGYTRRLERQQQRKEHQKQQQKLHFEESSYYAVPQKRSKIAKNEDNTKPNASPTPASYSPASRPVTIEDSPVPPPRHLKTLHEVNELYESNEELVPSAGTTGADKPENAIAQADTGLDNPSFLDEKGRVAVDSTDVFHF